MHRNIRLAIMMLCFGLHHRTQAQDPELIINRVANHWVALHNEFKQPHDVWGNYTLDLTLEAMLQYDAWAKEDAFRHVVLDVFNKRKIAPSDTINYKSQPFCSINFSLGNITENSDWFNGFIHESYAMQKHAVKSGEGGILINHKGDFYLLIDYLQEYASRLAKTGYLTQDTLLFNESVEQFLIYETIVRNDSTGLWCQGRGWCSDKLQLAQGAWSRGHGWLMRGIVTSLIYLPESHQLKLRPVLKRLSYSLLNAQSESGMYHILLNRPTDESAPDVSGTGMIAYYMALALENDWLKASDFKPSIFRATTALRKFITENGEVLSSSKGPGPLCDEDTYIHYQPVIDEKHGFQGAIYGMLAELLVTE